TGDHLRGCGPDPRYADQCGAARSAICEAGEAVAADPPAAGADRGYPEPDPAARQIAGERSEPGSACATGDIDAARARHARFAGQPAAGTGFAGQDCRSAGKHAAQERQAATRLAEVAACYAAE